MSQKYEYETSISSIRRIIHHDSSNVFNIFIDLPHFDQNRVKIATTINKARAISSKINQAYQVDPIVDEFVLKIPKNIKDKISSSETNKIKEVVNILLKSTEEKVEVDQEKVHFFNIVRQLFGINDIDDENFKIDIKNMSEAISFLNTDLHEKSIEYIASHFLEFLKSKAFESIDDQIIIEIIDLYFEKFENTETSEIQNKKIETNEKIFSILSEINEENQIIMHFLLNLEYDEMNEEMINYIISNLSDDIIDNNLSLIIQKFKHQLSDQIAIQKEKSKKGTFECKFEGNELEGIFYKLEKKFGGDLIDNGIVKLNDANTGSRHYIESLLKNDGNDYQNQGNGSSLEVNGWFEIDFCERKINLSSYTLKTASNSRYTFPKSWKIIASNDKIEWKVLDYQIDVANFKSQNRQQRFICNENNDFYRYIRYVQTDSWCGSYKYNIIFSRIELFGSVYPID